MVLYDERISLKDISFNIVPHSGGEIDVKSYSVATSSRLHYQFRSKSRLVLSPMSGVSPIEVDC